MVYYSKARRLYIWDVARAFTVLTQNRLKVGIWSKYKCKHNLLKGVFFFFTGGSRGKRKLKIMSIIWLQCERQCSVSATEHEALWCLFSPVRSLFYVPFFHLVTSPMLFLSRSVLLRCFISSGLVACDVYREISINALPSRPFRLKWRF